MVVLTTWSNFRTSTNLGKQSIRKVKEVIMDEYSYRERVTSPKWQKKHIFSLAMLIILVLFVKVLKYPSPC